MNIRTVGSAGAATVAAALLTFAGPATPAGANAGTCVAQTRATLTSTGSPFGGDGRSTITWTADVPDGCAPISIKLNGSTVARQGSLKVQPAVGTAYTLRAVYGSQGRDLGITGALGGKVLTYATSLAGFVPTPTGVGVPEAGALAHRVLASLSNSSRLQLSGRVVEVHVIPVNVALTDLEPWRYLRNRMTCDDLTPGAAPGAKIPGCVDDRPWNAVRGTGGTVIPGTNRLAVSVGAEEVTTTTRVPTNGRGHILVHELGHAVLTYATAPALRTTVTQTLMARGPNATYVGRDSYTSSSPDEYWAEGTAALFGYYNAYLLRHEYTEAWLDLNDRPLLGLLRGVYARR
ncbi:hypothetical protein GCM10009557_61460 [Virgisporangium ochraceum]|uniref:Uncharacterized protein n=1 Tax=Virgisporangium ochraceum TaxID=65505 RepID=A0A8J3ZYY1_9ACTN|nr:hypothetical protein [Virgisporangium ochraceum]GIJ71437.1 hypothetical protein Voc01_063540 [Virgisporangium ochraceum]